MRRQPSGAALARTGTRSSRRAAGCLARSSGGRMQRRRTCVAAQFRLAKACTGRAESRRLTVRSQQATSRYAAANRDGRMDAPRWQRAVQHVCVEASVAFHQLVPRGCVLEVPRSASPRPGQPKWPQRTARLFGNDRQGVGAGATRHTSAAASGRPPRRSTRTEAGPVTSTVRQRQHRLSTLRRRTLSRSDHMRPSSNRQSNEGGDRR